MTSWPSFGSNELLNQTYILMRLKQFAYPLPLGQPLAGRRRVNQPPLKQACQGPPASAVGYLAAEYLHGILARFHLGNLGL